MLDILLTVVMHYMKVKILVFVALEWYVVQYSLVDNLEGDSDPSMQFSYA